MSKILSKTRCLVAWCLLCPPPAPVARPLLLLPVHAFTNQSTISGQRSPKCTSCLPAWGISCWPTEESAGVISERRNKARYFGKMRGLAGTSLPFVFPPTHSATMASTRIYNESSKHTPMPILSETHFLHPPSILRFLHDGSVRSAFAKPSACDDSHG